MEIERELLAAIDQLAADGDTATIRCLAALLACDAKVEVRVNGWQHPFREYTEQEGTNHRQAVEQLIKRGIAVRTKKALMLNSAVMSYNKNFVASRCANRLFARAWAHFAPVLRATHFDDLRDLCRRQSNAAVNRAHRHMGARYWDLKRLGLLVTSSRTNPRVFPTLGYVPEVPRVAGIALTLEQGRALTAQNLLNDVGVIYQVALATGCLEPKDGSVALTDRGRELAAAYVADTIGRRLRWVSWSRTEAMHFLADELLVPLPADWVDGTPTQVGRMKAEEDAPLRELLRDKVLRGWMRRLVRRLSAMGVAQKIACRDGVSRYFFAPGLAGLVKEALGLPAEQFAVPKRMARWGWEAIAGFLTTPPEPEEEEETQPEGLTYLESLLR